jgi:hypothetical protein
MLRFALSNRILFVFFLFHLHTAYCQVDGLKAMPEWLIGLKVGLNRFHIIEHKNDNDPFRYLTGLEAGLFANFPTRSMYFDLEVATLYSQKGYHFKGWDYDLHLDYLGFSTSPKYRYEFAFLQAGFYYAYLVHARKGDGQLNLGILPDEVKQHDYGLLIGGGAIFLKYFEVSILHTIGLRAIYRSQIYSPGGAPGSEGPPFYNRGWSLNIGVPLRVFR